MRTSTWVRVALAGAILFAAAWAAPGSATPIHAAGTTITVNQQADGLGECATTGTGACSLRDAITFANANPGPDAIAFALPGAGVRVLKPVSALPVISETLTIDGYSQPGAFANQSAEGTTAILQVEVDGSLTPSADGLVIGAPGSTVRGLAVTRFAGAGIAVSAGSGSVIEGNFIGLTPAGFIAPNGTGIRVEGAVAATMIGGAAPASRNVISGNSGNGITLAGGVTGTSVHGNLIGTSPNGALAVSNSGNGIELTGAISTTIGGPSPNTIAFNGGAGVRASSPTGFANEITNNHMFQNAGLGIDLGPAGVTPNDPHDTDTGSNGLQNYPVLTGAFLSTFTGQVLVAGSQSSAIQQGANTIHLYVADTEPGREGRSLLKVIEGAGVAGFDFATEPFSPPAQLPANTPITATTTTVQGTSEFAATIPLVANARPVADPGDDATVALRSIVTLDASDSSDPDDAPFALAYEWTQTGGPPVQMTGVNTATPSFAVDVGGTYTFQLVVHDGLDESLPQTVEVSVADTSIPIAQPQTISVTAGEPKQVRLRATDTGGQTAFTFEIVSPPDHGVLSGFNPETGVGIYLAPSGFGGQAKFTFTASDGVNTSLPAIVTINVGGGESLDLAPATLTAPLGKPFAATLHVTGGSPEYSFAISSGALPGGLALNTASGEISGTTTTPGTFTATVRVSDANGDSDTATVTITVVQALPFRIIGPLVAADG